MDKVLRLQRQLSRWRILPLAVIGLTLGIFGGTLYFFSQNLRAKIQRQIIGRDGEILHAVTLMLQSADDTDLGMENQFDEPAGQLPIILQASRLKDLVAATRLFDAEGRFVTALPENVVDATVSAQDLLELRRLQPVSHYHAAARLTGLFWPATTEPSSAQEKSPLLEVLVPLHRPNEFRLLGIAQFILYGQSIAVEFQALDRNVLSYGLIAFFTGGLIIVTGLAWAFRRLQQVNRLLEERTATLLAANQELALAAKTSAVGAVTAHLIHGLKNPLSGLQTFVAQRGESDTDWLDAAETARRMQAMINEVVQVLREEQGGSVYELSLAELSEIVASKWAPVARQAGVQVQTRLAAEGTLTNRVANLVILILGNLIQNAIQATAPGKNVSLVVSTKEEHFIFEVADEGPGLPPDVLKSLFTPCPSAKEGGCGIGLAISKQLAKHIGADLQLKSSAATGCSFTLVLPVR